MKKKHTGTQIILIVFPTNSEAASITAMEICRLLHMQNMASAYKAANPQQMYAYTFRDV